MKVKYQNIPSLIVNELKFLINSNSAYEQIIIEKDIYHLSLQLGVIIGLLWLRQIDAGKAERTTARLLVGKVNLNTWITLADELIDSQLISPIIRELLSESVNTFSTYSIVQWRNEEIAHGALSLDTTAVAADAANMKGILMQYLDRLDIAYEGVDDRIEQGFIRIEETDLSLAPYIQMDGKDIYVFCEYIDKAGCIVGQCYANGKKKFFEDSQLSSIYENYIRNAVRTQLADASQKWLSSELSSLIDELNEENHYVEPKYISDWLRNATNPDNGGVNRGLLMIEMERGMGKSTYVRSIDGLSKHKIKSSFGDSFIRAYYCSRTNIRGINDFFFKVQTVMNTDSSGMQIFMDYDDPPRIKDFSAQEFAALLNWYAARISQKRLIFILDGLDELDASMSDIVNILPSEDMLDENVYLLITVRADSKDSPLPKHLKRIISEAKGKIKNPSKCLLSISSDHTGNIETLKTYLSNTKKDRVKQSLKPIKEDEINKILKNYRTFLDVRIASLLLRTDRVHDLKSFVRGKDLVAMYFDYLEQSYGNRLYKTVEYVLAVLSYFSESAKVSELAAAVGNSGIPIHLLAVLRDISGVIVISRSSRGSVIAIGNASIAELVKSRYMEACREVALMQLGFINHLTYDRITDAMPEELDAMSYICSDTLSIAGETLESIPNNLDLDTIVENISYVTQQICDGMVYQCRRAVRCIDSYETMINDNNGDALLFLAKTLCFRAMARYRLQQYDAALSDVNESIQCIRDAQCDDVSYMMSIMAMACLTGADICSDITAYSDALEYIGTIEKFCGTRKKCRSDSALPPKTTFDVFFRKADILASMKEYQTAFQICNLIVGELSDYAKQGVKWADTVLISAYGYRAERLYDLDYMKDAHEDYTRAFKVADRCHERGDLLDEWQLLKMRVSRARIYHSMNMASQAVDDCRKIMKKVRELMESEQFADETQFLWAYQCCSAVFTQTQHYVEAFEAADIAVNLCLKAKENQVLFHQTSLARCYSNRSVILRAFHRYGAAIADCESAMTVYTEIEQDGNEVDPTDVCETLLNYIPSLMLCGRETECVRLIQYTQDMLETLYLQGRIYSDDLIATFYRNAAICLVHFLRLPEMMNFLDRAVTVLREAVYTKGKEWLLPSLLLMYRIRAFICTLIARQAEALKDTEKADAIMITIRSCAIQDDSGDLQAAEDYARKTALVAPFVTSVPNSNAGFDLPDATKAIIRQHMPMLGMSREQNGVYYEQGEGQDTKFVKRLEAIESSLMGRNPVNEDDISFIKRLGL